VRKAILGVLAAAILAAVCWAGGDPWKDKPYTQWDDKDVQHVLSSSPWMRSVAVVAAWQPATYDLPGDNPHPAAPQQTAPSAGGTSGMGGQGKSAPGGSSAPSSSPDISPSTPQAEFAIYWMSSRTIREALGRRQILHAGRDPAEVEKFVNEPMDEYEIVVQGRDMAPFVNNDEKFFQSNAYLEIKKSKEKISPSHVTFERGANGGKGVTVATFFFPKKTSAGESVIAPDEKSVQFTVSLGKSTLKADFDPRKMDDQKGPDL
jgi:hypothetical protein